MRTLGLLSAVTLLALLSSAQEPAAVAKGADSTSDKAIIYIYRYKQFTGSALAPSVYCDDVQLARMENGRYFTVKLEPGQHVFRSNDKQSGIALNTKAGQQYFIRVEIAAGFMKGHGRLILVAPEQGRYEISSRLKPLDSDRVEDKARVSVEEVSMSSQPAN